MGNITVEQVTEALSHVIEPELKKDLITLDFVKHVRVEGSDVSFTIMLTTPACPLKDVMRRESEEAIRARVPGVGSVTVNFDSEVKRDSRIAEKLDVPIRNIIAVSSGKGGVGKTTVSVNLALSLSADGARTGVLDADIYGPNVPVMLGVETAGGERGGKILPAEAHGIQVMSMGFLIPSGEALVWRGPMLHSAISQLFSEVLWDELDYLVVDLPPGTGDAQLSLAQLVPLTGGVIVTGPQAVSVSDARRGVSAFNRLEVPVLGIIENMSGEIFGRGGGEAIAKEFGVDFLGAIDLHPDIPKGSDLGKPFVLTHPDHEITAHYRRIARVIAGKISVLDYGR
jgi:ATP-binding protein involved in chromosome partitioning